MPTRRDARPGPGVGEQRRADDRQPQQRPRAARGPLVPRDVVSVGGIVDDRDADAGLGDADPAVRDGLEACRIPRGVRVGGPHDVTELDLGGGAVGVHVHRDAEREQLLLLVPASSSATAWRR